MIPQNQLPFLQMIIYRNKIDFSEQLESKKVAPKINISQMLSWSDLLTHTCIIELTSQNNYLEVRGGGR